MCLQRGKWLIFEHLSNLHEGALCQRICSTWRCRDDEHAIHIRCGIFATGNIRNIKLPRQKTMSCVI
uniref:SRCR domain-containing protein n=1 Tax=Parascaris univalens TaxID=6257 RepID=A0A915AX86_PARUN